MRVNFIPASVGYLKTNTARKTNHASNNTVDSASMPISPDYNFKYYSNILFGTRNAFHDACQNGNTKDIEKLLNKYGNDFNKLHTALTETDDDGDTPLHLLSYNWKHPEISKVIAKKYEGHTDKLLEALMKKIKVVNQLSDLQFGTGIHF